MTEPLVSVVVPAHARPRELRATLLSLHRQTLPADRFEIIVVDDGSPGDVFADSADLVERDNVVTVRNPVGLGAAGARNTGAALARGRVLMFLDIDCLAHENLLEAHLAAQTARPLAACGYTHGRELTPSSWSLLLGEPWDLENTQAVFARAGTTPVLHDPLTELLAEPGPDDWMYFWTHNVSLRRADFERCGGFDGGFVGKGSEDLELGYRLASAGVPTVFLPEARAFHQPHGRDRCRELIRERIHDLRLLMLHPTLEVEALCSFDIDNARTVLETLREFAANADPGALDCAGLTELAEVRRALAGSEEVLLLGTPEGWPGEAASPAATVAPVGSDTGLTLLGTRLPFPDKAFDLALVTDYWRLLPPRTACRVFEEALRCSTSVLVLVDAASRPPGGPDPRLARVLEPGDRPHWESTVTLAREWHQLEFEPFDAAASGTARALRARARPWHTVTLSGVSSDPEARGLLGVASPKPAPMAERSAR